MSEQLTAVVVLLVIAAGAWAFVNWVIDGALRLAVLAYMRARGGDWVRSYELADIARGGVYTTLHELVDRGYLERKETPADADKRGGYPDVYYRLKEKDQT